METESVRYRFSFAVGTDVRIERGTRGASGMDGGWDRFAMPVWARRRHEIVAAPAWWVGGGDLVCVEWSRGGKYPLAGLGPRPAPGQVDGRDPHPGVRRQ